MRKSGGSGLPTTTGVTPAAAATAATSAPQPGRKSPPSIGSRGSTFGVIEAPGPRPPRGGRRQPLVREVEVVADRDDSRASLVRHVDDLVARPAR